jgi:hypothetical protein
MDQSGKGLNDKVKAIAMETFWVLEVILCWVVALPILLIVFLGLILWEKIEKMRLTQSRHPSGNRPSVAFIETYRNPTGGERDAAQ